MLESEPFTTAAPEQTQPGLLRRMFRLKDISFYFMIVLAWAGSIYTTYDLDSSRWYWYWLIPIFGLLCIVTQWGNVEPTIKARLALVARQVLHWGAVFGLAVLLYLLSNNQNNIMVLLDDRQGSFIITLTIALSTYLSGIYYDWRLCVVAIFIVTGGVINVAFANLAPILMWMGLAVAVVYFIGVWGFQRWQEWKKTRAPG